MRIFLAVTLSLIPLVAILPAQDSGGSAAGGSAAGSSSGGSDSGSAGGGQRSGSAAYGFDVGANYTLKKSDVITVTVYNEPDLEKTVRVEADGTVVLPLIGKLKVAGMSVAEAQTLITDLYNRDYLVNPQVSLLVVDFARKYVKVIFASGRAGMVEIPPDRDLTLTEAIASVGGIDRLGNPKAVKIKRVTEEGASRVMEVNFNRIITDPDTRDIILQDGDTISVPERII